MGAPRLTPAEVDQILSLSRAKKTQREIAELLHRDKDTVGNVIRRYVPTTILARAHLEHSAERLAKRLVTKAGVQSILEIFDRLDVLPAKTQNATSPTVGVYIGMPGALPGSPPSQEDIEAAKAKQLGPAAPVVDATVVSSTPSEN